MKQKRRIMTSLGSKMIMLIVGCALSITIGISLFININLSNILSQSAATEMNLFCASCGDDITGGLEDVEVSVDGLSSWVGMKADSADLLKSDRDRRANLVSDSKTLLYYMCQQIPSANDAYIHFAIDITGEGNVEEGAFLAKNEEGSFVEMTITQIQSLSDPSIAQWYYAPIISGKAAWLEPHYDESLKTYTISYVSPIYSGNDLIGIIGIDIDFRTLLNTVDAIQYKRMGYMYLKKADGSVHYHKDYADVAEHDSRDIHGDGENEILDNAELMSAAETGDKIIHYRFRGGNRVMVFVTLRNGMKLVLCDSYDDIYAGVFSSIRISAIISASVSIFFIVIAVLIARAVILPLRKLVDATQEIRKGNYDIELPKETNDEIGDLTRSFNEAIQQVDFRNKLLENLAYQDSLTKVNNSTSYSRACLRINEEIKEGKAKFAVVMLDLNYLKEANDRYGHAVGDLVLSRTANVICDAFPNDLVYRIGGDEFVVLLEGEHADELQNGLNRLDELVLEAGENAEEPYMKLSIAYGSSVYDPGSDESYESVYRRADEEMYKLKRRTHGDIVS